VVTLLFNIIAKHYYLDWQKHWSIDSRTEKSTIFRQRARYTRV